MLELIIINWGLQISEKYPALKNHTEDLKLAAKKLVTGKKRHFSCVLRTSVSHVFLMYGHYQLYNSPFPLPIFMISYNRNVLFVHLRHTVWTLLIYWLIDLLDLILIIWNRRTSWWTQNIFKLAHSGNPINSSVHYPSPEYEAAWLLPVSLC